MCVCVCVCVREREREMKAEEIYKKTYICRESIICKLNQSSHMINITHGLISLGFLIALLIRASLFAWCWFDSP